MKLSHLSETLIGSEIVKLGNEIKDRIRKGEHIYNFTIGDFDPQLFPIPQALEDLIVEAYRNHFTNYPTAEGNIDLREGVKNYLASRLQLDYSTDEILIASGGRPIIYAIFRAICDVGEKVIYAVPSWNNNHYTHFVGGEHALIQATADNNFMPTAAQIAPHVKGAVLLALCSPQNPTGTTFTRKALQEICELVVAENESRGPDQKKLYVLYDQMYSQLTFGDIEHHNPISLHPKMRDYTLCVDAISKVFAATGVRVGWGTGPASIIAKMKAILTHIGAWAPMAEQKAVAQFLGQDDEIETFVQQFKKKIEIRLTQIFEGLMALKNAGFQVDAVAPQAAIYLTVQFALVGKTKANGEKLNSQSDVTSYLLSEASLAIVPFSAFGDSADSSWYRLSVGTCKVEEIPDMLAKLKRALELLK